MRNENVILKFDSACPRDKYGINTLSGTVTAGSILKLIDAADLKANPRNAETGKITDDIMESIEETPDLFHFKSKGLLVSAGGCEELERGRYRLSFDDPEFEGVLDGGHNMLALAVHMIRTASEDGAKALRGKRQRRWDEVKPVWNQCRDHIERAKDLFDFLIPVEVLYPKDGEVGREEFENSILEIAQARNNNAELTEETKANKKGYYDVIKDSMDPNLVGQVEWKTNDGGRIKARDIVALALVPLSKLPDKDQLPGLMDFRPVALYRHKGGCVSNFNDLMASDQVSQRDRGDTRELTHEGVRSALSLLGDIPRLVDQIYLDMPEAYNKVSPGFGRISAVKMYDENKVGADNKKYLKRPPKSKYYQQEGVYDVPEGFILPIVWGLTELMTYKDGEVIWRTDPGAFLKKNLVEIMRVYHGVMSLSKYDPQGVAKTPASYELVASQIRALAHSGNIVA